MKTIKIKDIEISAEELRRIVKENEALLKEPEVKGRYFFPKKGESFYDLNVYLCNDLPTNHEFNIDRYSLGVFETKKQANLAQDKQKAIVACWKWQQENAPFEPDWGNEDQGKWHVTFDLCEKKLQTSFDYHVQCQFTLPYFRSEKDVEDFIQACKEHLTLLFTK